MSRTEPPSSPPEPTLCALCDQEIGREDVRIELRTRAVVCERCWRTVPKRGRNKWG
jgi:hypothetical protein